jgi:hypothetical protein
MHQPVTRTLPFCKPTSTNIHNQEVWWAQRLAVAAADEIHSIQPHVRKDMPLTCNTLWGLEERWVGAIPGSAGL